MSSNGTNANASGKNAESIIDCVLQILKRKGYSPVSQHVVSNPRREPIFTQNMRVDFFVLGIPEYESGLIVSSKRQDKPGSAAIKLYGHICHEIKQCYPCSTILVLSGEYWTDKIKIWAMQEIGGNLAKVFFSFEELLIWAENIPQIDSSHPAIYKNLPLF